MSQPLEAQINPTAPSAEFAQLVGQLFVRAVGISLGAAGLILTAVYTLL
jgi:hypothetical protein